LNHLKSALLRVNNANKNSLVIYNVNSNKLTLYIRAWIKNV
jgi:hypothetical protein